MGYFAVQFAGNEIAYRALTREVQDNARRGRALDDRTIRIQGKDVLEAWQRYRMR